MTNLIGAISGRRTSWIVVVIALLFSGVVLGLGGESASTATGATDALASGKQSTQVAAQLATLPASDVKPAVVLYTADSGTLTPDQLSGIADRAKALAPLGVGGAPLPVIPSQDGAAAIVNVPLASGSATETAESVKKVREVAGADLPAGVSSGVTGPAAIEADLAGIFAGANTRLLAVTALVVAVLLIVTYRSPVLWLIPLIVIGTADRVASILAGKVAGLVNIPLDEAATGILSVLVFGAGTDYALLLISRYRDELRVTENRFDAMAHALKRTGEAVISSAFTVVLALLTLLLSLTPTTRGLGLACAVGIVVAAIAALVVLPAVLVLFGRWIFWPQTPRVGDTLIVDRNSVWHRVGTAVERRPGGFVLGGSAVLLLMMIGVTQITTGLSLSDQFLQKPESISAGERLAKSFPAGTSDPAIVLTTPAQAGAVLAAVKGTAGIASATAGTGDASIARVDAVLSATPGTQESRDTIVALRGALSSFSDTNVGGTDAKDLDQRDAASRDQRIILPLILLLVFIVLVVLLRSLVAPVLLVITVLATYLASLGVSWWLFTLVFGFPALDVGVPLLAFLFLVALGVDYNIFLVTRAREEGVEHGTRKGMLRALAATGGVITSAGILLAAVFAVLGVLPLVTLAQIGVIVGLGVLIDTLLVRTILVPALALWLGDNFWWPRRSAEPGASAPETVAVTAS